MSKVFQAMEKARRGREAQRRTTHHALLLPQIPLRSAEADLEPPVVNGSVYPATLAEDDDISAGVTHPQARILDGQFGPPNEHLVSLVAPDSRESDQYRTLRHKVEQLHQERQVQVVAITSPAPGDGKTVTTLNLAGSLAQEKQARVLVVDADLRQPSIGRYLRMKPVPRGLDDLVLKGSGLADGIRFHRHYNLNILATTHAVATLPYEILKSMRLRELLLEARARFDYVLIDSPPLTYSDCLLLENNIDAILLVVTAHRTQRRLVEGAIESLPSGKLVGIVFNCDSQRSSGYYSYGGSHTSAARGRTERRG